MNGLIDTATGELLCAGFCPFTPGVGETFKDDVPQVCYTKPQFNVPLITVYDSISDSWSNNPRTPAVQPPQTERSFTCYDDDAKSYNLMVASNGSVITSERT